MGLPQQIAPFITHAFLLYFWKASTVSSQQQQLILHAYPLVVMPSPMSVGLDSQNECADRRTDCRVFQQICDHADYKQYMYGCCRGTCDPKCGKKVGTPTEFPWGDETKAIDEARERRNQEAIRRKYLGDFDYFRVERDELKPSTRRRSVEAYGYRQIPPEAAKWRDDDRWDRNNPRTLRRGRGEGGDDEKIWKSN
uniref:Uncharacterized protein n=1 Tax=Globodera rostochiensis TaxID=31243 RepID=A0A914HPI5_GLORO